MVQSLTYPSAPKTRIVMPILQHNVIPPAIKPERAKGHFLTRSPIAYDRLSILVDHFRRAWDHLPEQTVTGFRR